MDDAALLRDVASLFEVEADGTIVWPWMTGVTVGEAGSPELQAALAAFRTRQGIQNKLS